MSGRNGTHGNRNGDEPTNPTPADDVADALGVKVGSRVTIGYRAADASASASSSASAKSDSDESTETAESSAQGTQSTQTTQGEQTTQATENGRVSSDIMDNNGTEFRIAGIVDTGGNEVEADVMHTSFNQLVIRFAIPVAGIARLT